MKIKSLHREYIQKSRLFLYPALGIKRGFSVTPVQTYMSWEGRYSLSDNKLIIVYHMRDDQDFKLFEDVKLLGNPLFHEFFELEDEGLGAYVFDFSEMAEDYNKIVNGKYSMLSGKHKRTVLGFFKNHSSHHVYIESYLNPKKYFVMYSALLGVEISILKKVGELCSIPDQEEEELKMGIKTMNFSQIPVDLQA
jgi:hypothetical protein